VENFHRPLGILGCVTPKEFGRCCVCDICVTEAFSVTFFIAFNMPAIWSLAIFKTPPFYDKINFIFKNHPIIFRAGKSASLDAMRLSSLSIITYPPPRL